MKKLSARTKNKKILRKKVETIDQFLERQSRATVKFLASQPNSRELGEIIRNQCKGLDELFANQPCGEELSKIIQRQNEILKESNPEMYQILFGEDKK